MSVEPVFVTPLWTDAEINRFVLRAGLFERRGLATDDAEVLAERCLSRDRDLDDRRACIECKHLQGGGRCALTRKDALPKTMFQRCHGFEWQVPRSA